MKSNFEILHNFYFRLGSYISHFLLNRLEKQHVAQHKQITSTTTTTTTPTTKAKTTTTTTSTIASTEASLLMSIIEEQGAQAVGFGLASVAYTALGEGESAESAGLTFPRPNKRPSLGPGGEGEVVR